MRMIKGGDLIALGESLASLNRLAKMDMIRDQAISEVTELCIRRPYATVREIVVTVITVVMKHDISSAAQALSGQSHNEDGGTKSVTPSSQRGKK